MLQRQRNLALSLPCPERTFRYFRATPRRTARQNAARFIARIGERVIGFRSNRFDGREMIAVNYYGEVPSSRPRLSRVKRWSAERPRDNESVLRVWETRNGLSS